jgi:hypothetical protein
VENILTHGDIFEKPAETQVSYLTMRFSLCVCEGILNPASCMYLDRPISRSMVSLKDMIESVVAAAERLAGHSFTSRV